MSISTILVILGGFQLSVFCAAASSAAFLVMCTCRKKKFNAQRKCRTDRFKHSNVAGEVAVPKSQKKEDLQIAERARELLMNKSQKEVKVSSDGSNEKGKSEDEAVKVASAEDVTQEDGETSNLLNVGKQLDEEHRSKKTADVGNASSKKGGSEKEVVIKLNGEERVDDMPNEGVKIDIPKTQMTVIPAIVLKGQSTDPKELLSANVKEYRFAMPLTLEEYERGQRYTVAKASLNETGGGQGVELLKNEPFTSNTLRPGQVLRGTFTHKVYHLREKAPWFMKKLFPDAAFNIQEESWNAFPYTKTVLTNPGYMKDNFHIIIETLHTDQDGILENALNLSEKLLKNREVINLDIYNEHDLKLSDMSPLTDPRVFHSTTTGRGPLTAKWSETFRPRIRLYKVCQVYFKWFGLQSKVERSLQDSYPRLFMKFNREMFCWIDQWHGKSFDELEQYEREAAEQLRVQFVNGGIVGMRANELD